MKNKDSWEDFKSFAGYALFIFAYLAGMALIIWASGSGK